MALWGEGWLVTVVNMIAYYAADTEHKNIMEHVFVTSLT